MLFQGRYYEETPCSSLDILQIVEYVLEVMPVSFRVTSAIVGEGGRAGLCKNDDQNELSNSTPFPKPVKSIEREAYISWGYCGGYVCMYVCLMRKGNFC